MKTLLMMCAAFAAIGGFAGTAAENAPSGNIAKHAFSMSCKVTALNRELRSSAARERAVKWWRENHISKLWLESYRHAERVETPLLEEYRDYFRERGFEVSGLLTPTQLNDPPAGGKAPFVVCWSDEKAKSRLRTEVERIAKVFDTVLLDDFLFSHCDDKCERCRTAKAKSGISDWGGFRRKMMYEVCERDILAVARGANPKAKFIIKYPCWWQNWERNGYDAERQSRLFGACWVGTETRDAGKDPLQACWIVDHVQKRSGGLCGGGWYDGLDSTPEKFLEQAYYTILGGAKESLIHCYDYLLAEDPGVTPFGEKADRGRLCGEAFVRESAKLKALADSLADAKFVSCQLVSPGVSEHVFERNGKTFTLRFDHNKVVGI